MTGATSATSLKILNLNFSNDDGEFQVSVGVTIKATGGGTKAGPSSASGETPFQTNMRRLWVRASKYYYYPVLLGLDFLETNLLVVQGKNSPFVARVCMEQEEVSSVEVRVMGHKLRTVGKMFFTPPSPPADHDEDIDSDLDE